MIENTLSKYLAAILFLFLVPFSYSVFADDVAVSDLPPISSIEEPASTAEPIFDSLPEPTNFPSSDPSAESSPDLSPEPDIDFSPEPSFEPIVEPSLESTPEPSLGPTSSPHFFFETSFEDYTVSEGLLLLIFVLACLWLVFKLFK